MGLLPCQELLNRCVNLLEAYDDFDASGENNSVEEMLESLNSLDRADQVFVTEVFLGCSEFSKLLSLITDDYYEHENTAQLSDRTIFKIFTYLVTFRIQDLSMDGLSEFILQTSQAERVIQFLKFYLDEKKLTSGVSSKWYEICDDDFIDDQLALLTRALNELRDICNRVEIVLKSAKKTKKTSRRDCRCFGDEVLTLKPMMIEQEGMWNLFLGEGKADKDEIVKLNTWKKTFNHYIEGIELKMYNFDDNFNNSNNANTNSQPSAGETACKSKSKQVIRMNTAAILREGLLYKKKDEELMRKIDQWQSGSGDPMKYEEWQKKVKEEEDQKKYEIVEMSRLLGKLAQEQSILAKQKAMEDKKRNVEMMRIQAAALMQEYLIMKLKEEEKMRLKRHKVSSMKKDSKEARRKMTELKAKAVQSMQEEMKELMRIALEEAEEEMKQRLEVIRKIRELEANRPVRTKVVDLTETSGCGLHTEMSISELRERLKQMQEEEAKRIEAKKNEISLNKQMKEQMIQETLCNISRHRDEIAKAACLRQDERKRATSVARHKTPAILELEKKFEELRTQRISMGKAHYSMVDKTGTFVCTNVGPDCTNRCEQTTNKKSRIELLAI